MYPHRRWLFLACLAIAPVAAAQSVPKRLSADAGCATPHTQRPADAAAVLPTAPPPAVPDSDVRAGSGGCVDCGDEHFVPRRWHRFLPGMYR